MYYVVTPDTLAEGLFRAVAEFLFSIAHIFKAVIVILETRYGDALYGRGNCEYCMRLKIGRFMPHFGTPPFQVRT